MIRRYKGEILTSRILFPCFQMDRLALFFGHRNVLGCTYFCAHKLFGESRYFSYPNRPQSIYGEYSL